jgi:hypothetical protein
MSVGSSNNQDQEVDSPVTTVPSYQRPYDKNYGLFSPEIMQQLQEDRKKQHPIEQSCLIHSDQTPATNCGHGTNTWTVDASEWDKQFIERLKTDIRIVVAERELYGQLKLQAQDGANNPEGQQRSNPRAQLVDRRRLEIPKGEDRRGSAETRRALAELTEQRLQR